jgi:hypothetical protein
MFIVNSTALFWTQIRFLTQVTNKLINISYTETLESVQMKLVLEHNLDFSITTTVGKLF